MSTRLTCTDSRVAVNVNVNSYHHHQPALIVASAGFKDLPSTRVYRTCWLGSRQWLGEDEAPDRNETPPAFSQITPPEGAFFSFSENEVSARRRNKACPSSRYGFGLWLIRFNTRGKNTEKKIQQASRFLVELSWLQISGQPEPCFY